MMRLDGMLDFGFVGMERRSERTVAHEAENYDCEDGLRAAHGVDPVDSHVF
jgi:hypothetical protein